MRTITFVIRRKICDYLKNTFNNDLISTYTYKYHDIFYIF